MEFLRVFDQTWNLLKSQVIRYSHEPSLCPDLSTEIFCSTDYLRDARTCASVLLVLPLVNQGTRSFFRIKSLRDHIQRMAENYRLEGDWKLVQEILESTTSLSVRESWMPIFKRVNENDWFGNWVPELRRALRALKSRKLYFSVENDKRPVKYPVRKRGYNDKGSRRPDHKWLPTRIREIDDTQRILPKEPPGFQWFGVQRN